MLDELFAFKIGDKCAMKALVEGFGWGGTQLLAVTERHLQQCEGGVQKTYLCRIAYEQARWAESSQRFAGESAAGFYRIKESELIPWDAEAYGAATPDTSWRKAAAVLAAAAGQKARE